MYGSLTIVFACLLLAAALPRTSAEGCFDQSPFDPLDWKYCHPINDNVYMYYTPREEEGVVLLGFHALRGTQGWTALAMGGNGGMKGASQIVVRQDEAGAWVAEDRYSMDYTTPILDEQQDVELLFAQQENGQTAWGVVIPQNSCDTDGNDYPIEDHNMNMHWAIGDSHVFGFHGSNRGQFKANLMNAPSEIPTTEGMLEVDLIMPNVSVVLGEGGTDPTNPYICSYFDLAVLGPEAGFSAEDTVHVTRFSPILAEKSRQYVHHMILYACGNEEDADEGNSRAHLGIVPECESMPPGCDQMKWPWAVGSTDLIFPEDVGMPIGSENRWLVLQVHYYNPNLDEGVVDSSGARAYVTPALREQEAGVLELNGGTGDWHRDPLPTGLDQVTIEPFVTPSECTSSIWAQPLNVLGVAHHMHLYGYRMTIDVVRDGVNLGPIRHEYHYDFNHQSLEEPEMALRQLLPGDQITMRCTYNTRSAPGDDVAFGDLTQQEMCYAAVVYYPKTDGDALGYLKPFLDYTICTLPATEAPFVDNDFSLCAQRVSENVPRFFDFEQWVTVPFDLLTACNSYEAFQDLHNDIPGLCPMNCAPSGNCTEVGIAFHAQEGICSFVCDQGGVSVYPDVSRTDPISSGNYGCPQNYFREPTLPDAPVCEIRGDASSSIQLEQPNIVLVPLPAISPPPDVSENGSSVSTSSGASVIQHGFVATGMLAWLFISSVMMVAGGHLVVW